MMALYFASGMLDRLGGYRLQNEGDGRGDWTRTSDFYVPNVAPYQLGHTPTFDPPNDTLGVRTRLYRLCYAPTQSIVVSGSCSGKLAVAMWASSPSVVDVRVAAASRRAPTC